jgi:putative DNA primase/helicase
MTTLPANYDDGWNDAAAEASERVLRGALLKFGDGRWSRGTEGLDVPNGTKLVALDTAAAWVKWSDGKPVEYRMREPGQKMPDLEEMPDRDKSQWEPGPDGITPRDPWQSTRFLYLVDPQTAEAFTFSTSSWGGRGAVADLGDQIGRMRFSHPGAVPLVERHAHDLRYVAVRNQWYKWDGTRWAPEHTLLVFDLVRESCRDDAKDFGNGKPPEKLYSAKTIAAVHWLVRSDRRIAATLEQFDSNNWLLTTEGETIDLRTGVGYPPDPADYISKKTACCVAPPGTPHPVWSAFLERIAPDPELGAFLQRYFGYCLTGWVTEHQFAFGYGTGANGKGTLLNTAAKIFGDYATIADVGTFIASNHDRHPTDVAKLHGARLVVAQETEKGRRWDETKIKTMTGGDKMTARFMRQDYFDFDPTFKLFITGNHMPGLETVDVAIRRRLRLLPFLVQIPDKDRDPDLARKLEAEWPAILRWMVDGCLEWQRMRLAPPTIVTDATNEYFDDQDVTQEWLDECTEHGGPDAFTLATLLFSSWKSWCDHRQLPVGSLKALSGTLMDRGFAKKRDGKGRRGFAKIVVKDQRNESEEGRTW